MTVIQHNKINRSLFYPLLMVGVLIFAGVAATISIYSETVSLKHDIISLTSQLSEAKLANAELKNVFYRSTNQEILENVARERGLIKDNNPKWVFASQF